MNKKAIFAVVTLGLSLISGQALNEVIFEDKDFSKDGWSDFRDISNGAVLRHRRGLELHVIPAVGLDEES